MDCKICKIELNKNSKILCNVCTNKRHKILCKKCGKECEISAGYVRRVDITNFNCRKCKSIGEGNPNFGKKWTEEKKKEQSEIIKSKIDNEYRKNCAKGMKGKTVTESDKLKRKKTIKKNIENGYVRPKMSDETKNKIGLKSASKFTDEYKQKIRKINEDKGVWVKLENKKDYIFYRELSNWDGLILNNNIIGIEKLKNNSFYSKKIRNKNTIVRDHIFGRKNGFNNSVFPEIVRHPANCQLITHSENIKKSLTENDSEMGIDELFEKIINWEDYYFEQELCVKLISDYKNGFRYVKEDYIHKIKNYEF